MVEKTINLMNGEIYYYLNNKNSLLSEEILIFMINETQNLVNIFNFFDENSILSQLNKTRKVKYNQDLGFLLEKSLELYTITQGLFNIFLGKSILDRKSNLKSRNKKIPHISNLIKFSKNKIELKNKDFIIDLGGIAKGYIIDKVLERTKLKYNNEIIDILIDARGDIVCYGKNRKEIEIENPFNEEFSFEKINLKTGSIITSGHNKQIFKEGSHIIGGKSDILTITLKSEIHNNYILDSLGTYLIQLTSEEVLKKIEFDSYYENIDCLLILENGKILKNSFW